MRIALYSDIHTELQRLPSMTTAPSVDVTVLAGDITAAGRIRRKANDPEARGAKQRLATFLQGVSGRSKHVVYVFGNHEYYGSSIEEAREHIETFIADYRLTNIRILDNESFEIGGVRFLGTTLWSDIPVDEQLHIQMGMRDYDLIRNSGSLLTPRDTVAMHKNNVAWLKEQLMAPVSTVVVTHHAPSFRANGRPKGGLSSAFCTDLDAEFAVMTMGVKYWFHGHTHYNTTYRLGEAVATTNQLGYYGFEKCPITFEQPVYTL